VRDVPSDFGLWLANPSTYLHIFYFFIFLFIFLRGQTDPSSNAVDGCDKFDDGRAL
jgi:hypothetical protein